MSKKVIVGLDIGVASVGWCITDYNNLNIIRWGVELHDPADDSHGRLLNEERRAHRGQRRRYTRLKTRKRDFIKYIIEQGFLKSYNFSPSDNDLVTKFRDEFLIPYDRKQNGLIKDMPWVYYYRRQLLTSPCTEEDFIAVLYWYIGHRGSLWQEEDNVDSEGTGSDSSHALLKNQYGQKGIDQLSNLKSKSNLPVDLQITNAKYLNKYRHISNWTITNNQLQKELKQILNTQQCPLEFSNKILCFFKRQRDYSKGPGGVKSPTPYGLYRLDEKGNVKKEHEYLWGYNVGNCSVLPDEKRGPKGSLTFECFCLLNDLTNLRIDYKKPKKLTSEDKKTCFKIALKTKSSKAIVNQIKKHIIQTYNCDEIHIKGFRVNKSKKEIITELTSFHLLKPLLFPKVSSGDDLLKCLDNIFFEDPENFVIKDDNFFDAIAQAFVDLRRIEERQKKFNELWASYLDGRIDANANDEDQGEHLQKLLKSSNFNGRTSLSLKIMKKSIPEIVKSDKNFEKLKFNPESSINNQDLASRFNFKNLHQIKLYIKEQLMISPTARRSLFCSLNVIGAIEKYCKSNNLDLARIAIEMTRSKNNKQEKEFEKELQKINEKNNDKIEKLLKSIGVNTMNLRGRKNIRLKYILAEEQGWKDPYSGQTIDQNPEKIDKYFQIDHIIPYSWCYDDSLKNKVLTSLNQEKGQQTPYQSWGSDINKWNKITKNCELIYLKNPIKRSKILTTIDYSLPENRIGFIGRNLVDTSYTVKNLLQILKYRYAKEDTHLFAINGKSTHYARIKSLKKGKDRSTNHHHAEDAFFLTILCKYYKQAKANEKYSNYEGEDWLLEATSDLTKALEISAQQINNNRHQIHFWRASRRHKFNVQFYNETLYSSVPDEASDAVWKIEKINLLELKKEQCKKKLIDKPEKILAYRSNPDLVKAIQDIYQLYSSANYPFKTYLDEIRTNENSPLMPLKFMVNHQEVVCNFLRIKSDDKPKSHLNIIKVGNQNNKAFHDTFNWIQIWVYKNQKGKYCLIPINAKNAIFDNQKKAFIIKPDILDQQKNKKNIPLANEPCHKLFKYDLIKIKKDSQELYYVNGLEQSSEKLELKKIDLSKSEQKFYSLNTALKNAILIRNNILGQKKSKSKLLNLD